MPIVKDFSVVWKLVQQSKCFFPIGNLGILIPEPFFQYSILNKRILVMYCR